MPPPSQKNRTIGFALMMSLAPVMIHDLTIRPEELQRIEPYRTNPHNTIGGAYVDSFGRGIGKVVLSGTTGWRGGAGLLGLSGEHAFIALRQMFTMWDRLRERAHNFGLGPESVRLALVDTLNSYVLAVVPLQFQLQRSKQQPLISKYNIELAVVGDLEESLFSLIP